MTRGPFINHAEMVWVPGKREAAEAFFDLLGFRVVDSGNELFPTLIYVDPDVRDHCDNVMYASEATPAQQNFEKEFARVLLEDPQLAAAMTNYKDVRRKHPQFSFHFGVALPSHEDWKARVKRLQEAARSHPLLAGHLEVMVFEPGVEFAVSPQSQAFIRTDVVATEGFAFGLEIELQWTPRDAAGNLTGPLSVGYLPPLSELT